MVMNQPRGPTPTGAFPAGEKEVPSSREMPRPLIAWGILAATVSSLRDNFDEVDRLLDIDEMFIDVQHPNIVQRFPMIHVSISQLTVESSGFYHAEYTVPREFVLVSKGTINLTVITRNPMQLLSIQDHISQLYLMSYLWENTFYYAGHDKAYVNLAYQPGAIDWSGHQMMSHPERGGDSVEQLYTVSTNIPFRGDHSVPYHLNRISRIDIDAIPYRARIKFSGYPGPRSFPNSDTELA